MTFFKWREEVDEWDKRNNVLSKFATINLRLCHSLVRSVILLCTMGFFTRSVGIEFQDVWKNSFLRRRGERRDRETGVPLRSQRLCLKFYATTALRMAINLTSNSSSSSSRNILAPSLFAIEGLGWVSIKSPSAPAAIAALAIVPII